MLRKMLEEYKKTKSISQAADICEYLIQLYEANDHDEPV